MNIVKTNESNIFKALSEDIRLRIIVILTDGELCVCDIMEVLSLPQSSVSRHMAKLKSSKLVIDRRDGKWVYYRLDAKINERIPSLTEILNQFRNRNPYMTDIEQLQNHKRTKLCK